MVKQCSYIVDQDNDNEIAESIGKQFVYYVGGIRLFEFKLTHINNDILKKIK